MEIPLKDTDNLNLLPERDKQYILDKGYAFTINNWGFYDFVIMNKRYISICQRNYPVVDLRFEWLYDTHDGTYILSERGYNEDFLETMNEGIIIKVDTLDKVIEYITQA